MRQKIIAERLPPYQQALLSEARQPARKQSEHQTINDTRNMIKDFFVHADSAFLKGEIYVCHNCGKYLNRYFNNSAPEGTSEIAKNHKTNSGADWKAWENLIGRGMTTQQKKEMAALVQKQIESSQGSTGAVVSKQQAEKKNEDATVSPIKKKRKRRYKYRWHHWYLRLSDSCIVALIGATFHISLFF